MRKESYGMTSEVVSRGGCPGFDLTISSGNGLRKEQRYEIPSLQKDGARQEMKEDKNNTNSKEHIRTKDLQRPSKKTAAPAAATAGNAATTAWVDNCAFSVDHRKTFKRPSSVPEVASPSADIGVYEHDDHGTTYKRPSKTKSSVSPKAIAANAAGMRGQHFLIRISFTKKTTKAGEISTEHRL